MNVKTPSLAAALLLTAAAAGAEIQPNPFETLGAYDVPGQWASKDCQHVPCARADAPQTAKAAPELPPAKSATIAADAPVYGSPRPGLEEGEKIANLMASMNGSEAAAPRQLAANADSSPVPNATTVVHVGGDQARINSGVFTFLQTRIAAEQMEAHRNEINTPGNGFAVPGQIINPNAGTSNFTGRPTRTVSNTKE
jgi:hypothetical protein